MLEWEFAVDQLPVNDVMPVHKQRTSLTAKGTKINAKGTKISAGSRQSQGAMQDGRGPELSGRFTKKFLVKIRKDGMCFLRVTTKAAV